MSGDSFMEAIHMIRSELDLIKNQYFFADGNYFFNMPSHGNKPSIVIADAAERTAHFVDRDGLCQEITGVEKVIPDKGPAYLQFRTGAASLVSDRQAALVRLVQPYTNYALAVPETSHAGVLGAPVLSGSGPPARIISRERAIATAIENIAIVYASSSRKENIQEFVLAVDFWFDRFMKSLGDKAGMVLSLYERHCLMMTDISGLTSYSEPLAITQKNPNTYLYGTSKGSDNERNSYMISPIQIGDGAELIITPLPHLWVLRLPKHWWESETSFARSDSRSRTLYTKGRKFCDVHIPIKHYSGIDTYLLAATFGFHYGIDQRLEFAYAASDWVDHHVSWMTGNPWMGDGGPYDPVKISPYVQPAYRYDAPPLCGSYAQGTRAWPWYMRSGKERIGYPDFAKVQGRNGMNTVATSEKVRWMAMDYMAQRIQLTGYQPFDHSLACFYYFVSRMGEHDVRRLLGR